MSDLTCPYCRNEQDIYCKEGKYEEDEVYQETCEKCGKHFVYYTNIHVYHNAEPADCLNSKKDIHKWTDKWIIQDAQKPYKWKVCTVCGEEKMVYLKKKLNKK